MKFLLHFFLSILFLVNTNVLFAQGFEIEDPNLQLRNLEFSPDVYIPELGTKGMIVVMEYYYTTSSKYLVTFKQNMKAFKYGTLVYDDSSSYLVMRPNEWNKVRKFIPYRKINVPEGMHQNMELEYSVPGLFTYKGNFNFNQPARYAINLDLTAGKAKPRAGNYDNGSPTDAAPDIYWTLTTNDGILNAFESQIAINSKDIPKEKAEIYVLEGEKIYLNVFDDDGSEDQRLGKYELGIANTDLKKTELGRMFNDVMGVGFNYSQRKMIRQPISTYVRHDAEYMGRKGVQVNFEYFLPQAMKGKQMKPSVEYTTKNKQQLTIPYYYPLNNSPREGETITLEQQGVISYFVPHYAWNSAIQTIKFAFEGDKEDLAEAAPYFIHSPIEFGKFISYSGYFLEDNYKYRGTSGVKVSLKYRVNDINKYSKVEVNFLNPDKSPIQFDIYPIDTTSGPPTPIPNNPLTLPDLGEDVVLEYFIPYIDLDVNAIRVELNMVPDMSIPIVHETSARFAVPEQSSDGLVEKVTEQAIFKEGDYGFVVTINCKVPAFYRGRSLLDISATRNGIDYTGYNAVSDMVDRIALDTFDVVKDSGTIYLIFPYRRLSANDKITVNCQLIEKNRGIGLSDEISAKWELPKIVHNVQAEFDLNAIEFDDTLATDSDENVDWKYTVSVGNELKISKTLPKKLKGKDAKSKFSRSLLVNREDLIQIKVVNKENEAEEIFIWSGDLGKFQQNKFRSSVSAQPPLKKAKVSAKVSRKALNAE